jgi:hypothetical protein
MKQKIEASMVQLGSKMLGAMAPTTHQETSLFAKHEEGEACA